MQEIQLNLNLKDGLKKYHLSVPSKWNELSAPQFLFIASNWNTWKEMLRNGLSIKQEKANLFIELLGIKSKRQRKKVIEVLSFIDEYSGPNILATTDFLFDKLDLTKNIISEVRIHPFKKLYGPADALKNCSIDELSFAFYYYTSYTRNKDPEMLNLLFATLYRDYDKTGGLRGDVRVRFNPYTIEQHAAQTKKISAAYKQATYLMLMGTLELLGRQFPFVFKRLDKNDETPGTGSLLKVIIGISGGKFGDFERTKNENAYVVLMELNNLMTPRKK